MLCNLYMEFYADMSKMWWTKPENCQNLNSYASKIRYLVPVYVTDNSIELTMFMSHMQNLVKIYNELWT